MSSLAGEEQISWNEIKGSDLLLKVLKHHKAKPFKIHSGGDDDDDDDNGDVNNTIEEPKPIQSGDTVLLNLIGRQADNPDHEDGPIFQQAKSWLITVGEPYCLVRALEYGLKQMKEGQTAVIFSTSKYNNIGDSGVRKYKPSPTAPEYVLPVGSSVIYEVTVTQIVIDTSRLNPYFPIQKALTMKNIANDIYQYEWDAGGKSRERAIHLYEKAGKAMKTLLEGTYFANVEEDHPQRKECRTIMLDSFNNVVAVYMRAKRWQKAREAANVVLKEDPKNTKALLRYAKCYMMDPDGTMEEKDEALKKAEKVVVYKDKEETELRKLRAQWKKKQEASS